MPIICFEDCGRLSLIGPVRMNIASMHTLHLSAYDCICYMLYLCLPCICCIYLSGKHMLHRKKTSKLLRPGTTESEQSLVYNTARNDGRHRKNLMGLGHGWWGTKLQTLDLKTICNPKHRIQIFSYVYSCQDKYLRERFLSYSPRSRKYISPRSSIVFCVFYPTLDVPSCGSSGISKKGSSGPIMQNQSRFLNTAINPKCISRL